MQKRNPISRWFWSSPANFYILLLILVGMNLSVNHASTANRSHNETDRLSLLEFKHQIYDPYGVLSSWNNSQHHCQWQGVTCDTRHQRVNALTLTGKSLSGTISPHVGNLSFLKSIHLEDNQFHGEIPQQVGRLFRLRFLNLSNNILTGEIPVDLSNCSQMINISLSRNKLEGKVPVELCNLKKLEIFSLSQNNLAGEIPSSIGNLSSLTKLFLTYNNLEGNLPGEIGLLTSLSRLGVGKNYLSGMIPAAIYNMSALLVFSVTNNFFHGNLPTYIGLSQSNLQILEVGANKFYGDIPISITNASKLEILDLGGNKFQGQVPKNLGDLSRLRKLNIERNLLGSNSTEDLAFISSLTNCSNLINIFSSQNNFGGEIPKVMANLSSQLTALFMGGNHLSGTIPEGFGDYVYLSVIELAWNSLSGVIPRDFGKFQNLQFLALQENRLSGQILSTLSNVSTLYLLDLSYNQFEGHNILDNVVINYQNLQELYIDQNNFSGVLTPHFFDMHTSLINMSLGHNTFSGSLPLEVGKLIHLVVFYIPYNNFSGEIPTTIGDCSVLQYLYMQGNFFQGTIPPDLASLKSIQEIDLSSNNLTGQIPSDLKKLRFLRYLNLSYNALEGEIPTTGIFANSSQISLIGNSKLCGGIPELNFPPCPVNKGKNKGKLKAILVLSTILPVTVLSLGILLFYFLIYRKRDRRKPRISEVATRIDKLIRVSYHELNRATSGFSPENLVGSGSFGMVYKGKLDQHGDRLVAVKVLDLQKNGASKSFNAECKALANIRHRNLVSILTYCSSIDSKGLEFKALVYEFMENGNLDLWLHPENVVTTNLRNLNLLQRLNIAIEVASSVNYLHNQCEIPIAHCDLKPSNILLDIDLVAHVGDFGLARLLDSTTKQGSSSSITVKGTVGYAAPEYGMGLQVSTQGDVYSYGILLLEMFTGKRPTEDIFMDGLDLHNFVKLALPEQFSEIVDPLLFSRSETDEMIQVPAQEELNNYGEKMECLSSILKIGMECSTSLPNDRMHMNDVLRKLHLIKDGFLGAKISTVNHDRNE